MTKLIKKYKNRRLYDTEISKYITVDELQVYVRKNIDFRVEDATTKADITNLTLLQIFVDMESGSSQLLSADSLRLLIVLAAHPMHRLFKDMLAQSFLGIEKMMKDNPYLKDYGALNQVYQQAFQSMIEKWQMFFK